MSNKNKDIRRNIFAKSIKLFFFVILNTTIRLSQAALFDAV